MRLNKLQIASLFLLFLAACRSSAPGDTSFTPQASVPLASKSPIPISSATATPDLLANLSNCQLSPLVVPTLPAVIPGYTELDPTTNLHMTGTYQMIDLTTYRLKVTGLVDKPLNLTLDELRCLPKVEATVSLICPGVFQDHATWAGTPIHYVLEMAGIQSDATKIYLVSADGYADPVSVDEALSEDNFLAYEWDNQPLPILHGFPLRAVFPTLLGNNWVKWLVEISVR